MAVPRFRRIGFCTKTHGVNGQVRVFADEGKRALMEAQDFLFFNIDGSMVPQKIVEREPMEEGWLVGFERVRTREEATVLLTDKEVHIVWSGVEIEEEEIRPLAGWTLLDRNTDRSYSILEVREYPEQLMMMCEREGVEKMIPLVPSWIIHLDEQGESLEMDLPDGL